MTLLVRGLMGSAHGTGSASAGAGAETLVGRAGVSGLAQLASPWAVEIGCDFADEAELGVGLGPGAVGSCRHACHGRPTLNGHGA